MTRCAGSLGATFVVGSLILLSGCALPGVHREAAQDKRVVRDGGVQAHAEPPLSDDEFDAGSLPDPRSDPANLNEDYSTFRSLVPAQHVFAEWPMPDNSKHSNAKHSYTVDGPVITDNVTKLRWQAKMPRFYPGCTARLTFVDRPHPVGTGCQWEQAKAYCERPELSEQLGGGSWRLPTKIELESLIDASRVNTVDYLFDDFPIDTVWSSSPYPNTVVDGLKMSWQVDFTEGTSGGRGRTKGSRVRCVSSPSDVGGSVQQLNFVDQPDSNVALDLSTTLQWQRFPDSATRSWREALEYCDRLALNGGGWRLPSMKELLTIVDSTRHQPALNMRTFPNRQNDAYWSSSEYLNGRNMAYVVEFEKGGSGLSSSLDEQHFVRCVR